MKQLLQLASEIQSFCENQKWRFCFIGGIALLRWGEPRLTVDVDLSLFTGFGDEERFVKALGSTFDHRIKDVYAFALRHRVLLLTSKDSIPIDISLAALPFEETAITRATDFSFSKSVSLRICSAEDLIVFKAFANRNRDWADIEGILLRQKNKLDWQYIERQLQPLVELKNDQHILPKLQKLRSQV